MTDALRTVTLSDGSVWWYAPRWDDDKGRDDQPWHPMGLPRHRRMTPVADRHALTAADHRAIAAVLDPAPTFSKQGIYASHMPAESERVPAPVRPPPADTERLDWLEGRSATVRPNMTMNDDDPIGWRIACYDTGAVGEGGTLREAIDDARFYTPDAARSVGEGTT